MAGELVTTTAAQDKAIAALERIYGAVQLEERDPADGSVRVSYPVAGVAAVDRLPAQGAVDHLVAAAVMARVAAGEREGRAIRATAREFGTGFARAASVWNRAKQARP